jgi:hypothetical protein
VQVLKIMTMLSSNPYTWGYIDQHAITTAVPTLSFKYANGSDLLVTSLPSPIEIVMFESSGDVANYSLGNSSLLDSPQYDPLKDAQFTTWTLPGGETKKLVIDGSDTGGTTGVSALQVSL